jgi:hypothetical protein
MDKRNPVVKAARDLKAARIRAGRRAAREDQLAEQRMNGIYRRRGRQMPDLGLWEDRAR